MEIALGPCDRKQSKVGFGVGTRSRHPGQRFRLVLFLMAQTGEVLMSRRLGVPLWFAVSRVAPFCPRKLATRKCRYWSGCRLTGDH